MYFGYNLKVKTINCCWLISPNVTNLLRLPTPKSCFYILHKTSTEISIIVIIADIKVQIWNCKLLLILIFFSSAV